MRDDGEFAFECVIEQRESFYDRGHLLLTSRDWSQVCWGLCQKSD
jgi:hypothetical protein